jgi:hypothetical protein
MAIAALAVWVCTAAAGVYLLTAVVRRPRTGPQPEPEAPGATGSPASAAPAASAIVTDLAPEASMPLSATGMPSPVAGMPPPAAGTPAPIPQTNTPAPIPQTKASPPPGDHPVLEFCHPALGVTGLACWFAFVATHDRTFAKAAIVFLVLTLVFGLGWAGANALAARRHAGDGTMPVVPAHRIVVHGLAAATTCVLAIIAILVTSHG